MKTIHHKTESGSFFHLSSPIMAVFSLVISIFCAILLTSCASVPTTASSSHDQPEENSAYSQVTNIDNADNATNQTSLEQQGTLFPDVDSKATNTQAQSTHAKLVTLNNNQWTKENETLIAAQLSCAKSQAQKRQEDALAKAAADKKAQEAALSRNDVSYAQPHPTTVPAQSRSTQASFTAPAQAPDTIEILGAIIPFIDAYDVTRAPEHGAGVWRGDESTTDGKMCYFVGHNPGDFRNVMRLQNGDTVTVCDTAGQMKTYTVHDCFTTLQKGTYNDVRDRVEGHGESIAMQTCCGDGINVRIVVAW